MTIPFSQWARAESEPHLIKAINKNIKILFAVCVCVCSCSYWDEVMLGLKKATFQWTWVDAVLCWPAYIPLSTPSGNVANE